MCGIIGITSHQPVAESVLEGLKRLEYRGYDSAGIATVSDGSIARRRAAGKLSNLAALLEKAPLPGATGIGHTRWATHGAPSESNAHPHATGRVAAVHNGIIENFAELRDALQAKGYSFSSQTDSEVIPVLVTSLLDQGYVPEKAAAAAIAQLRGAFAFALIFRDAPELLIGARRGAPLAVGYGKDCMLLGSDAVAVAHITNRVAYLEEGDWAILTPKSAVIFDKHGSEAQRAVTTVSDIGLAVSKGNYRHFMQKEIYEQPAVLAETLSAYYDAARQRFVLPALPMALHALNRLHLVACGSSFFASLVARYWFEDLARLPVDLDIASEFRYRTPILRENEMTVAISQSGETADTLAALRYARQHHRCVAIVNVTESTMAREADVVLRTLAGAEIGVASTKAYTAQLGVLACLALMLAQARGTLEANVLQRLTHALLTTPSLLAQALELDETIAGVAADIVEARDVLYLGRGTAYATAHEGALKLKEISYIHAEAYAAGEMKHGPIALIDEHVPIIAIAPSDGLFEKTASNLQEAAARGGRIIALTDRAGAAALGGIAAACIVLPDAHPFITPLLYTVPVQLLAYHVALLKGTDVDQPRNLAKSVTVE